MERTKAGSKKGQNGGGVEVRWREGGQGFPDMNSSLAQQVALFLNSMASDTGDQSAEPQEKLRAQRQSQAHCFLVICKQEKTFDMKDCLNCTRIIIKQLLNSPCWLLNGFFPPLLSLCVIFPDGRSGQTEKKKNTQQ